MKNEPTPVNTRRQFLKQAGTAGAALSTLGTPLLGQEAARPVAPKKNLCVGFVGVGVKGSSHVGHLLIALILVATAWPAGAQPTNTPWTLDLSGQRWQFEGIRPGQGEVEGYFQTPKRSFDFVERAYQPLLVSLQFDQRRWLPGETFTGKL